MINKILINNEYSFIILKDFFMLSNHINMKIFLTFLSIGLVFCGYDWTATEKIIQ